MCEEIKMKKCSKCGEEKPATKEYFHVHNGCKDGLNSVCKKCRSEKAASRIRRLDNVLNGYKKCVECGEILEINSNNFKSYKNSLDGFYNVCISCQIKRRRNGADEGYKKCHKCKRILLLNRDYYQPDAKCLDGYRNYCWECMDRNFFPDYAPEFWNDEDIAIIREKYENSTIKEIIPLLSVERTEKSIMHMVQKLGIRKINNYIENYNDIKYKFINDQLYKYCKSCNRYLPFDFDYFPKDDKCTDGLRNVCRECRGENFRINSRIHKWTEEEEFILKEKYSYMTNNELINTYFQFANSSIIMHKARELGVYKTNETLQRCFDEIGKFNSSRLLELNKWVGEGNPQYNSQRFGELNPNYKGGISALSQELRRNIKQWKIDSMENANYKCIFTNKSFDNIHHLYSFDNIVRDTLKETQLPLYENISQYTQEELQQLIDKCLEIHYRHPLGVCMQEKYHIKFHMEFGYGNNTSEQFYEFLDNYYSGKYKDLEEKAS
ncbi:hypothetical protein [Methanoculleus sp.]|uniref:hypothetical protein n=1 Tax=Methanoculleus sp. TaxID=90427 RepID=UPI0025FF1FA2|nr:hypothetical protein [Methanoculleus sp.]MCK9319236.1 hypothetical protein [Methanoculleus sp.]